MRLIDADALPAERVEWEDIINAPTIDPIEIIKKMLEDATEEFFEKNEHLIDVWMLGPIDTEPVTRCEDCENSLEHTCTR